MTDSAILLSLIGAVCALLQIILLGLSGWTLLEVVQHGKAISSIEARFNSLPCEKCESKH